MDIARLYDEYGDAMYRYLVARLGSAADAEDVLQEVFCRLVRRSTRLRLLRKPRAFVFRVARNEANRFLKTKIQGENTLRSGSSWADAWGKLYEGPGESTAQLVAGALSHLPEEQREVVILKIFEGLTFREIAAVSGVSLPTAASRYRYALDRLRGQVEGRT